MGKKKKNEFIYKSSHRYATSFSLNTLISKFYMKSDAIIFYFYYYNFYLLYLITRSYVSYILYNQVRSL